ncbi:MAG: Uma2 family endonuclease [Armatimonadetes bacterium]|nr:Uma2 family endonuclease [Armatimonadota bacterium]
MSVVPRPKLSPEEYLAVERSAEWKHEYLDGDVFEMARSDSSHNLIVSNLVGDIGTKLRGLPCEVLACNMRMRVAERGPFTYPDVLVVCAKPVYVDEKRDTLLNPKVLFEVLSDSTEANDRGWKWAHYRHLASLAEYVMISQDHCRVEQYVRQPDGDWTFREYRIPEDSLRLPSLECEIALADIYHRVELRGKRTHHRPPPNELGTPSSRIQGYSS